MTSVCPKCGHSWSKHDATYWPSCVGNKDGGLAEENCGCTFTREQAEREARSRG